MYGREVPAYTTLLRVSAEVNADVLAERGADAERLGSIGRVTAERHGAIRVGTPEELRQVGRIFAGFGMHPVGFYDLRDASASSVPVVSTAFRPLDAGELARNPFRVFTSVLVTDDRRFFSASLQERLETFLARRQLFPPRVLELAARAESDHGLGGSDAAEFVEAATACFALSREPIDRGWYDELARISAVAADIGGVSSTHINHLTPRVLDIDELYRRMTDLGVTMIDEIQGPPAWEGPDVLLRQTSFRALAEPRGFTDGPGELRVRFGEVEARGIALTAAGRSLYDELLAEVDARRAASGRPRTEVAAEVWRERLPATEEDLDRRGLGAFTYRAAADAPDRLRALRAADREVLARGAVRAEEAARVGATPSAPAPAAAAPGALEAAGAGPDVHALVAAGIAVREPIVYEDFLPRSAAGIFQSNLTDAGQRDDALTGTARDVGWMSDALGRDVADPIVRNEELTRASLQALTLEIS
ncbi:VOC family protein [Cryptosporangium phraense]|uniref:2-oxoadipate dioxygenase/decarboxylase n=2 Tax=Cryptosporangium phraense TaxID=2593070 RepID=A0A545B046_9ACTN|nr:VOC family protein [Cryptosporangium phraense]